MNLLSYPVLPLHPLFFAFLDCLIAYLNFLLSRPQPEVSTAVGDSDRDSIGLAEVTTTVEDSDGDSEGVATTVGNSLLAMVGDSDMDSIGLAEVSEAGLAEGTVVGVSVGLAEGAVVGVSVGLAEGAVVGVSVGLAEGAATEKRNVSLAPNIPSLTFITSSSNFIV
jgi:hypothetical protein